MQKWADWPIAPPLLFSYNGIGEVWRKEASRRLYVIPP